MSCPVTLFSALSPPRQLAMDIYRRSWQLIYTPWKKSTKLLQVSNHLGIKPSELTGFLHQESSAIYPAGEHYATSGAQSYQKPFIIPLLIS